MEQENQDIIHKRLSRVGFKLHPTYRKSGQPRRHKRNIYEEVKRLSGSMSSGVNTRPTTSYQEPSESGAAEDINRAARTCTRETAKSTRSDELEALVVQREHVTDETTMYS